MRIMEDNIILFVKFGKEKRIKSLLDGKMYFSNAETFRGVEKKTGLRGQGDAFEAILQFKNGDAIMTDHHTGRSLYQPDTTLFLGLGDTENIPVFCITYISSEDCEIWERNGKRVLTVHSALRDTIRAHFPMADTAGIFFQPQQFMDSLDRLGVVFHDRVRYFNFSPKGLIKDMIEYVAQRPGTISKHNHQLVSMQTRTDDGECSQLDITEQNMKRILFCKDCYFAGEKEYRIVLPQKRICTPREYAVRWGKQKRKMYPVDEFFNGIEMI